MGLFGGSSKSNSSYTNITTTSDERIAAADNAVVVKDALNNIGTLTITDGGAFQFAEKVALAALSDGAESFSSGLDKVLEYMKSANEKTTTDTTGAQKLMPWIMGGVAVIALSQALKR